MQPKEMNFRKLIGTIVKLKWDDRRATLAVRNGEAKQTGQQTDGHVSCYRELQWMLPRQLSSGGNSRFKKQI